MYHVRGLANDKPRYYRIPGDIAHDSSKVRGIIQIRSQWRPQLSTDLEMAADVSLEAAGCVVHMAGGRGRR